VKRWLVTGGVGFIGHHLARTLLARGDGVRVVDDFSNAPYPTVLKRRHAETLMREGGARFSLVEQCITKRDPTLVEGVDGVIHLAGLAGVRPSFADPARYMAVNVEGTANLLDAAQRAGLEVFAFASSSSVYGNSTPLPANEDAVAIEPESPYAASKRSAELAVSAMVKKTPSMRCPLLRFFTVYGPWQRPEMAISSWLRKILAGQSITMFGDGSMRRDFTHVDDIVPGILAAVEKAPAGARAYNLGSGAPIALNDLVAAMGRVAGKNPVVVRAPVPLGDVDATFADITRARAELGWQPKLRLEDGLQTVVDWLSADHVRSGA
jgi:UDP-glucuronate 4-epimerase